MSPDPTHLPPIVTRAEALAAGLTVDEVRQRVRSGRWRRLDTGVYLRSTERPTDLDDFATARLAHVERAVAAVRRHRGCTIGYGSAALALNVPLTSGTPELVQVLVPPGGWTGIRNGVRYRTARLDPEDVAGIGVATTSIARTIVDVARMNGLADGLATGDAALRRGETTHADVRDALDRLGHVRGIRTAATMLDHLDGRRETALESLSWARFVEWGLPLPTMQREFWDADGFVGRVDFWWDDRGVVGEADGRLKYSSPADLYAEKLREDRLRALGCTVVRWGWSDLWGAAAERLRRRLVGLVL